MAGIDSLIRADSQCFHTQQIVAKNHKIHYHRAMKTFYIASALFILFIAYLLNKPIENKGDVARAFSDSEILYLERVFDYAMNNLKAGESMDWKITATNGRITAGESYESTQGANCRNFVEVSRTQTAQKVDSGVACQRAGNDGWCRVYGDNPKSCALEVAESMVRKKARYAILTGIQTIDSVLGTRVGGVDTSGLNPTVPPINRPSLGKLPDIDTPDIKPSDLRPPMPWDASEQRR